jgi:Sec-independent protein translocase protein TatA
MGRRIPPGGLGLIILAAALVPVAIRKFRPAVRWLGKQINEAGDTVARTADDDERREAEKYSVKKERRASGVPDAEVVATEEAPPKAKPATRAKSAVTKPKKKTGPTPPASNPKRTRKKPEGSGAPDVK